MEKDILEYFSCRRLKKLSEPTLTPFGVGKFFSGVTIPYIHKYIAPEEDLNDLIDYLVSCQVAGTLNSLYCGHVNDVVFESAVDPTTNWKYKREVIEGESVSNCFSSNHSTFLNYVKKHRP